MSSIFTTNSNSRRLTRKSVGSGDGGLGISAGERQKKRRSRRERGVRQRVGLDQSQQHVAEQVRVVAIVEAVLKLLQVRGQMLFADLVVRADHRAVKERPRRLDGLRVNVAAHPFLFGVPDALMLCVVVVQV